jgi:signal transduction histidine kinase/ActR/RegA family two-component response regulator/HPt (histidine-containing phosphotransfer) domain-containing protein
LTVQLFEKTSTGLRVRLLAIILLLIAPIAIFDAIGLLQVRATRIRITQERAYELAKAGAARFQDTIDDVHTVLDLLSRVPEVTNGSPEVCAKFLKGVAAAHQWARSFSSIGANQRVVCSTNADAVAFDLAVRPWFQIARQTGGFNVSGFLVNQVSEIPTTFATLFYQNSQSGEQQALTASIDLAWFDRLAATFGEKQDALVLLIDSSGVILSRYPAARIPGNALVSENFLKEISAPKESMFAGTDPDGGERLFGSVAIPEAHAHVVVGFVRAATLGLIDKYAMIAAIIFGGVMLCGGFVVWVVGDRIFVRPIEELNGLLGIALSNMPNGLCMWDKEHRLVISNNRYREMYGLTPEQAKPGTSLRQILETHLANGETSELDIDGYIALIVKQRMQTHVLADGRTVAMRRSPMPDGGWVATHEDITDLKRIETELRHEKDRAETAARATAEFLSNMSHELRTPLTAIIGVSDMLLNGPQSADQQRRFMEMQRNAGRGLLSVINDILDFSKIEAGQLDLEAAPFSLKDVAEDCIKLVSDEAQRKGLKPMAAVGSDVHDWVIGDSTRLRQVLLNLVSNGVKFTHSGYVALTIERVPGATHALRFVVADTGIGIKPEDLALLFQRFAQADSSTTRRFGGSGLGLAISKQLVALMGGDIEVWSEFGQGSTFSFTIELPPGQEAQPEFMASLPQHRGCYRLLLAEDNELNRQLIKAMLEHAGHKVVVVNDGAEAVRIAIRNEFDAILMDVHMPEMDGYAATRAIRNATRHMPSLPIIALTANALPDEAERCLEAGMNVHVPKPVNWPALFTTLDRLVLECRESGGRESGGREEDRMAGRPVEPGVPHGFDVLNEPTLAALRTSIGDHNTANLLKLFVVEAQRRFLSPPVSAAARRSMAEEAHTFGGSAAMLGFEALADACAALNAAVLQDAPLDEFLERARYARDAALMKIEELIAGGEFTHPVRTTA